MAASTEQVEQIEDTEQKYDLKQAFCEYCQKIDARDALKCKGSDPPSAMGNLVGTDAVTISLQQVDKWLRQAKIIDDKIVTTVDVTTIFNKFKAMALNMDQFENLLEDLAKEKGINLEDMTNNLIASTAAHHAAHVAQAKKAIAPIKAACCQHKKN